MSLEVENVCVKQISDGKAAEQSPEQAQDVEIKGHKCSPDSDWAQMNC